ncbi:MAG TPA: uroporphyrinogen-III C-methyltransferase [Rugosibacter sp.]
MEHENNALLTQALPVLPGRRRLWSRPSVWALLILLALILAQWVDSRKQISAIQQEVAHRLVENDQAIKEIRFLAKQTQDTALTVQAKVTLLEERLAEIQSQSVALQSMYQEMSSSRDQRLLAEVEQAIVMAMQQLQFAGNVETALIALENADARLAKELQPQFISLRRLLARDILRLKATPGADLTSISLKIESIVSVIDTLPLAFEQRPKNTPVAPIPGAALSSSLISRSYWQALVSEVWQELYQLLRIERIEHRDPALLSPSQSFFLRENLKLRLLNARLALLQRDGKTFRDEIIQTQALLDRYFDVRAPSVVNARKTLNALAATDVGFNLPSLGETLAAVRNLKLSRDRGVSR